MVAISQRQDYQGQDKLCIDKFLSDIFVYDTLNYKP